MFPVLVFLMSGSDGEGASPSKLDECVSQNQLQKALQAVQSDLAETITRAVTDAVTKLHLGESIERLDKRDSKLTDQVVEFETAHKTINTNTNTNNNVEDDHDEATVYKADGTVDMSATRTARLRRRLQLNPQGMGGFHNHNRRTQGNYAPDDPYAKIKFSIPSFSGQYDGDAYLDWEMTVEQKFNAHLVPEQHRVRQTTSEFKDFAIIWWSGLAAETDLPTTWEELKVEMGDRFVPPSFYREIRNKLQHLDQGDKTVQEYFSELQKGLIRCAVVEKVEDQIYRFYSGLRKEI